MPSSVQQSSQHAGPLDAQVRASNQTLRVLTGGVRHSWMTAAPSSTKSVPLPSRSSTKLGTAQPGGPRQKARDAPVIQVSIPVSQTAATLPTPGEAHADHGPQSHLQRIPSTLPSPAPSLQASPITAGHVNRGATTNSSSNEPQQATAIPFQAPTSTTSSAHSLESQRHMMPLGVTLQDATLKQVAVPDVIPTSSNRTHHAFDRSQSGQMKRPAPPDSTTASIPSPGPKRTCQHAQAPPMFSPAITEEARQLASGWLKQIDARIERFQGLESLRQSVERPRYRMLQEACARGDLFYVILHQFFCLWTVDKATLQRQLPLHSTTIDTIFQTMLILLRHNEDMATEHLIWFAHFPGHHDRYMERFKAYSDAQVQLTNFARIFCQSWDTLVSSIPDRRYPLMAWEAIYLLNCPSSQLQTIFFTFTRRILRVKDGPFAVELNNLFLKDQQKESEMTEKKAPVEVRVKAHEDMACRYSTVVAQVHRRDSQPNTPTVPLSLPVPTQMSHRILATDHAPGHTETHTSNSPILPTMPSNMAMTLNTGFTIDQNMRSNALSAIQSTVYLAGASVESQLSSAHRSSPVLTTPISSGGFNHAFRSLFQSQQVSQLPWSAQIDADPNRYEPASAPRQTVPQGQVQGASQDRTPTYPPHYVSTVSNMQPMYPTSGTTNMGHPSSTGLSSNSMSMPQQGPSIIGQRGPHSQQHVVETSSAGQVHAERGSQNHLQSGGVVRPSVQQRIPENEYPSNPYDWTSVQPSLHLVRLRSPERTTPLENAARFYQFVFDFASNPVAVLPQNGIQSIGFTVSNERMRLLATSQSRVPAQLPVARHFSGSFRYRLRLCFLKPGQQVNMEAWTLMSNSWPEDIYITMNGKSHLPRRKQHFHHDLPIELTESIRLGQNTIAVSLPEIGANLKRGAVAHMAVEVVHTIDHPTAKMIVMEAPHVSTENTKREIQRRLQASISDDIIVENDSITLLLTDPFSSVMCDVPVRGVNCKHLECFDLETWLRTRPCKPSRKEHQAKEPCMVDVWKCPICSLDARPPSLRVDDFFAEIRAALFQKGQQRTKQVRVDANGNWTPVVEKDESVDVGPSDGDKLARSSPTKKQAIEVIEILDD